MAHHDTVYVEEAKVPEGGFVVVHHLVDSDSDTGDEPAGAEPFQVIGHTPVLRPASTRTSRSSFTPTTITPERPRSRGWVG